MSVDVSASTKGPANSPPDQWIFRIAFRVVRLLLAPVALVWGILLGSWIPLLPPIRALFDIPRGHSCSAPMAGYAFCVILLASTSVISVVALRFRLPKTSPQRRLICSTTLLGGLSLGLILVLHDVPPPPATYTWDDIPRPASQAEVSYAALQEFGEAQIQFRDKNEQGKCFLYIDTRTNSLEFAHDIETEWAKIAPAVRVLEKMNTFDGIADLSTPQPFAQGTNGYWQHSPFSYSRMRQVTWRMWAYAYLRMEQGRSEEACSQLVLAYSIARKSMPYSRQIIGHMFWMGMAGEAINETHHLVASPKITPAALEILRRGMPPLEAKHVDLRGAITGSSILYEAMLKDLARTKLRDVVMLSYWGYPGPATNTYSLWMKSGLGAAAYLSLQENRTLTEIRAQQALKLADAEKSPPNFESLTDHAAHVRTYPRLGNLVGWEFIGSNSMGLQRMALQSARTKVTSDLLAIELDHKLGGTSNMPDYFTGKPYLTDATNGEPYSAGPDGVPNNDDDVRLGKW